MGETTKDMKVHKDKNVAEINKSFSKNEPFYSLFIGKRVMIQLVTGQELFGVLISNNYNKFDVLLKQGSRLYLVPKHAIAYIQLREPDHRRR